MLAVDVIEQVKRQRNVWTVAAIASLILNVIQFIRSKIVVMSRGTVRQHPNSAAYQGK